MLGVPGGTWAAHVVLFRAVGMERGDDELMPELADFADQSGLANRALCRRGSGRRYNTCHGAFCRLPGDFALRKSPQNRCKGSLGGID